MPPEAVSQQRFCEAAIFEQLVGRLQFAAQCYPAGRQRMHAAWRVARARFRVEGRVRVTRALHRDLTWWTRELRDDAHEGVPLAAASAPPVGSGSMAIYADASGEQGFAAWTLHRGEVLFVEGEWTERERDDLIICEKELLASTFGLAALQPAVGDQFVLSYTDNTNVLAAMRSMGSTSRRMQELVAQRTAWMLEAGVVEAAARVTSANNVWADWGSRARLDDMVLAVRALGLRARRIPIPPAWRDTSALCALQPDSLE